MFENTRSFMRR